VTQGYLRKQGVPAKMFHIFLLPVIVVGFESTSGVPHEVFATQACRRTESSLPEIAHTEQVAVYKQFPHSHSKMTWNTIKP
jgi:hypothetical protein